MTVNNRDAAQVNHYALRVLNSQAIRQGTIYQTGPIPPFHVAAVLHALADHTHIVHILRDIVEGEALATVGDDFNPPATSLGRYFHALADAIEDDARSVEASR